MNQFPSDIESVARELSPALESLEKGRLKSLNRIYSGQKKIGIVILITLGILWFILATTGPNAESGKLPVLIFSVGGIGILTSIIIYFKFVKGHAAVYRDVYKRRVIAGITQAVQPDMSYSPAQGISQESFEAMGLYSTGIDRYHCEDLFAGKVGKTALMFSEAHAEDKQTSTDSKGNTTTHWVTIFKGVLVIADFHKDFNSWLTIKPDFAESSFGWLGRKFQGLSASLIRLENPDFENAFVVHGGDQVEARYLLTPDMQERLLDLRQWFGTDIRMALHGSRLHLTIPKRTNWFEPDIKLPAHNLSQMKDFLQQMNSIFRIVEMLDLNTRIWSKQ